MSKPQDFGSFVLWLLQADTLACLAIMLGVGAWLFFVFAEQWARDGAKMWWAPWMQNRTPATYRRMGHASAILALVSAASSFVRFIVGLWSP